MDSTLAFKGSMQKCCDPCSSLGLSAGSLRRLALKASDTLSCQQTEARINTTPSVSQPLE